MKEPLTFQIAVSFRNYWIEYTQNSNDVCALRMCMCVQSTTWVSIVSKWSASANVCLCEILMWTINASTLKSINNFNESKQERKVEN